MSCETYLDRIKKIKSEQKITNDRLSEMTGIPLGTLSKLLAGINESPKLSNMVAIAKALGCSLDYLVTGVPENTHNYTLDQQEISLIEAYRLMDDYGKSMLEMVTEKERDRASRQAAERALLVRDLTAEQSEMGTRARRRRTYTPVTTPTPVIAKSQPPVANQNQGGVILGGVAERSRRKDIRLYDLPVSAGVGEFLSENGGTTISIPVNERTAHATYALRISGNSMEPRYQSGDVLLVEACTSVNVGELGIFVLDGSGYFKEYGGESLISFNPAYEPIWLKDFERVECCGRVVGKLKRK